MTTEYARPELAEHPADGADDTLDRAEAELRAQAAASPTWSQLAAGVAVASGVALLLLQVGGAGRITGIVLFAAGAAATTALEWVRIARRRAAERRSGLR